MAEVYADRGSTHHKSSMSWILIAIVAAILLAIIIAWVT